jgi:hypothetical protein
VIGPASMFVTYLWHYLVARLLYDELVRPLTHGRPGSPLVIAVCTCGALFILGRLARRMRR